MSTNKKQRICQCCGMPLEDGILGRKEDGTLSEDYCQWCYVDGKYTYTDMDKMIDICVVHMANESFTEDQYKAILDQLISGRIVPYSAADHGNTSDLELVNTQVYYLELNK